jgi:hypothetical protein
MLPHMNRNLNSEELDRGKKEGKQCGRSDNPNSFFFFFFVLFWKAQKKVEVFVLCRIDQDGRALLVPLQKSGNYLKNFFKSRI